MDAPRHSRARLATAMFAVLLAGAVRADDAPRIDHLIVGVADLDQSLDAVAKVLGVTPRYGGKHPGGTHNALVSLGPAIYLEFIALQPGVDGAAAGMPELDGLRHPTPLGWAVAANDAAALQGRLVRAGFEPGEASAGSRTTPAGDVLRWNAFEVTNAPVGAPFFIVWAQDSAHPATTSPSGCTLTRFSVATPDGKRLRELTTALGIDVDVSHPDVNQRDDAALSITLACPTGSVTFPHAPVTGADRDAHDCIPSAGYSWCARTQQCERPWELAKQHAFENTKDAFDVFCGASSGN